MRPERRLSAVAMHLRPMLQILDSGYCSVHAAHHEYPLKLHVHAEVQDTSLNHLQTISCQRRQLRSGGLIPPNPPTGVCLCIQTRGTRSQARVSSVLRAGSLKRS